MIGLLLGAMLHITQQDVEAALQRCVIRYETCIGADCDAVTNTHEYLLCRNTCKDKYKGCSQEVTRALGEPTDE